MEKMLSTPSESYKQIVTPNEAASILGVTPHTLAVWRSTGRYDLPFVKVGRKIRYRFSDLEAWLKIRTCKHTGQIGIGLKNEK